MHDFIVPAKSKLSSKRILRFLHSATIGGFVAGHPRITVSLLAAVVGLGPTQHMMRSWSSEGEHDTRRNTCDAGHAFKL